MNPFLIDCIGYGGLVINLYSMSTKGEYKLRLISLIANIIYILYGALIIATPIIVGCTIAVFLHGYHLRRLKIKKKVMIKIQIAKEADTTILALLARVTWAESHGHYIDDKNNLLKYLNNNFSVSKTKQDINNPKNLFYIIYVDDLPVGYAKLVVNAKNKSVVSQNNCRLERIFIQNEFIPLKIGQQLLNFVEEKAKALQLDTIWLSVYIKNKRAIRFYERNEFENVGELNFPVNGKLYENIVFSKKI